MKLSLPLHVVLPRKKGDRKWILNLNTYRNTHYHTLNQVKVLYKEAVYNSYREWLSESADNFYKDNEPYIFCYTIFPSTGRRFDVANVLTVVDKFTCDALIDLEILRDDFYRVIPAINYRFGRVDKENPRVELEIAEWR